MKRDMELVRELLRYFEAKPNAGVVKPDEIVVPGYDSAAIHYHVILMCEAGLLSCEKVVSTTTPDRIVDANPFLLTWAGHEFLDAARDDTVWSAAKGILRDKGLSAGAAVLQALLVSLVKQQLRLS